MNPQSQSHFGHHHSTLLILLLVLLALLALAYAFTALERKDPPKEELPRPSIIRTTQTGDSAQ